MVNNDTQDYAEYMSHANNELGFQYSAGILPYFTLREYSAKLV